MACVRVGILGCAEIARKNVRALAHADGIGVAALASRDKGKAQSMADNLASLLPPDVAVLGSYNELIAYPDLDAVYIPLPSALHVEWVAKAAAKGLHILLEKPIAINADDMAAIFRATEQANVQLMDGTMWTHSPRTSKMEEIIRSPSFGPVIEVTSAFSFRANHHFLEKNIRTQADADPLGCLGDLGWYCIRGALWAFNWEAPQYACANAGFVLNNCGVPMYCSFTLIWPGLPRRRANITCSFELPLTSTLDVYGSQQSLYLRDLALPFGEFEAKFTSTREHGLGPFQTPTTTVEAEHTVRGGKSQETCMWEEFARCVSCIQEGGKPNAHWPNIARLTQQVCLAVSESMKQQKPIFVADLSPATL